MKPLLAILGPTAAGKTSLALNVAKQYAGEIISADSRQIYVGLDIGTDKIGHGGWGTGHGNNGNAIRPGPKTHAPKTKDQPQLIDGIRHYLIDILTPDVPYSAAEFRDDAYRIIADIHARGRLPIVVGGTGLYVRALTERLPLSRVPPDRAFRAWAHSQPLTALVAELQKQAPARARQIDLKNSRRVIRALEIERASRKQQVESSKGKRSNSTADTPTYSFLLSTFNILKLALAIEKDELKKRIEERVDTQLQAGLIEEVQRLVGRYGEQAPGLQAIGYREVFPYLRGDATLEETRDAIIHANWRYARRQLTWLRKEPNLVWVHSPEDALDAVKQRLDAGSSPARQI